MEERSKRVVKNSLFLYFRMIFLMCIALYTSRVILANLGVSDFGLYNVVGGLITIFTFVNGSMAQASQRYITFYLGKNDFVKLSNVFSQSFYIHLGLAILIFALIETIGLWYFYTKMIIDPGREHAAEIIFHVTAIITFLHIIVIPYRAAIVSHEKMSTFAYISIVEGILKLLIAILISCVQSDKLIVYGLLMLLVTFIVTFYYIAYSRFHFRETKIKLHPDFTGIKHLFSFAGWSLFGSIAAAGYTQGLNLLLNAFFNTSINAARGLSTQIQGVVRTFASNFMMAVNPQITKSYASNDLQYFYSLIFKGSIYSFFLFLCIASPVFWCVDFLLHIWLVEVPDHTVAFVRIMLLISCVEILATPLNVGIQATGKNKYLEFFVSTILLLIVPASYIALKFKTVPEVVFIVDLLCVMFAHAARIIIAHRLFALPCLSYFRKVITPIIVVASLSSFIIVLSSRFIPELLIGNIIKCILSFIITISCVFVIGLDKSEKRYLIDYLKSKILR